MDLNRMTERVQQVLAGAQELAQSKQQQELRLTHLLSAMLKQDDYMLKRVLEIQNIDIDSFSARVNQMVDMVPSVSASSGNIQLYMSQNLHQAIEKAWEQVSQFGDEYLSIEHLLLAFFTGKDYSVAR